MNSQDEIEYLPPRPPAHDILGGAGSYSALGARLFSPPPLSKKVGWIVDKGSDFPPAIATVIDSWETSCLLRSTPDRLTTRGWNGYVDASEKRAFRYTTEKKRLTVDDLEGPLLQARSFHIISNPERCGNLVQTILDKRKEASAPGTYHRPFIIWEPVPDKCTPDELLNCTNALPLVDVCSPNHAELAGFMGSDGLDSETGEIDQAAVEQSCEQLLGSMPLQSYTLVIRAGEKGCYIAKNGGRKRQRGVKRKKRDYVRGGLQHDTDMEALFAGLLQDQEGMVAREEIAIDPGIEKWIPAYHGKVTEGEDGQSKVIDPTGGGNTFLGVLAVALARGKSIEEACCHGAVAASFAIEQVGMPVLGRDKDGQETWNGVRVEDRLSEFMKRLP